MMTIHKEGRTLLFGLLVVLFLINFAVSYFLPELRLMQNLVIGVSVIFYLLILQFFRSPVFDIPRNDNQVLAPADGKVVVIEETTEAEYLRDRRKQVSIFMKMKNGTEILFRQIAGALARRIKCYVKEGQPLQQGDEFGFIKFGSRVDVFLPLNARIVVKPGDITKGGRTVIAEF